MDAGLVSLKAASKNVAHKTGKFLGEKNRFAVAKLCNRKTVNKKSCNKWKYNNYWRINYYTRKKRSNNQSIS